jgi:DIS3-like exonuclease 2
VSASPYVQTNANFLVEEYMLLANMRVAAIIARAFPKHALLRCVEQWHACVFLR